MVTKRGFGSGILNEPDKLERILEGVSTKINIELSIKCRLGFENENDIFSLIKVYNKYPLKEIIVHSRTAKQMYKGLAKPDVFYDLIKESKHKLVYNGDIILVDDYYSLNTKFEKKINTWMIGRGLLQNPFLANEINGNFLSSESKKILFEKFYNELFEGYRNKLQPSHILMRMQIHWEYFSFLFINQRKIYKSIKKANNINVYTKRVDNIFIAEEFV